MVDRNHINGDKLGMLYALGFPTFYLFKSTDSVDISPKAQLKSWDFPQEEKKACHVRGAQMGA